MERWNTNIANTTRSRQHRPRLSSLADLITQSEDTIASSQATVITNNSQRTTQTRSMEGWNDFQDYQDFIGEQTDTLRINPEEERRIQTLLELARKGKINPGNAFEVPIKVANSQGGQVENMRFWKFASQLLSASMGIYDKRVEHVYLGTNRMFDSLVRVGTNSTIEGEEPQERNKRQRGAILKMDLSDIGSSQNIASYDFGKMNCQEPQKLNAKKSLLQFTADPMFNKRLQAFDSDSLKSLFLNAFQTSSNLQVKFFHDSQDLQSSSNSQMNSQIFFQPQPIREQLMPLEEDEESTRTVLPAYSPNIPFFISEDLKKLNFMAHNNDAFQGISQFKRQNQRQGLFQGRNLLQDFSMDLDLQAHQNPHERYQQPAEQHVQFDDSKPFQESTFSLMPNDFTQYSEEPVKIQQDDLSSSNYPRSERYSPALFLSATRESGGGDMTPWELQFRGMRLQKKKQNKKEGKKGGKKQKKKEQQEEGQLDFLDNRRPRRADILKCINFDPVVPNLKYKDKNIVPLNVDPFTRLSIHVPSSSAASQIKKHELSFLPMQCQNVSGRLQIEQSQNPEFHSQQEQAMDEIPFVNTGFSQNFWGGSQTQRIVPASQALKNIRAVKQRLTARIRQLREVRMSEIDIGLNFSSILVVILHLANEYKVQIIQTKDDDMVIRFIQ